MILRKALVFATIYLIIAPRIHAQGTVGCSYPLGMNNGAITDSQLFASSVDRETSSAQHARLNQTSGDEAWCAKSLTRNPQLQINLIYPTLVTKLAISGRRQEYVSGLIIEIKTAPNTNYSNYNQGRVITVSPVAGIGIAYIDLVPSIFAYEILFTIVEHVGGAQCMGVELYGCYLMKGKVKYYNIQDGNDNHFYDYDYNGTKSTLDGIIYLSNGIGKLTDGTLGSSKPSSILSNEWIGWSSVIVSVPTLTFAFATEQIFYQVYIHCLISYPFTLFKYANLSFSNDSSEWTRPVIYYANKSPTITSEAFFITFKLHNETGRYIKLELAYSKSNAWIGLSEIWFMSREVNDTSFNTITVPTSESRPTRTTLVSTTASTEKPRLTMKSTKPPTMATTATTRTVITIGRSRKLFTYL
ncbi:uncharacterized protein TRIADDRAFT_53166 [Trichoplax adhaerens]|uniref:F5/8 type C domain-containing protein n=1 Tax=Trichoplax adhaerens TaxID=10228 RepID=B3RNH3_TRIAD|nr:hypothetical protein TRIADDRAFT_53166 [Trichoplax adhaerens]EDV27453.1 hypothetical protein TRIADDRAFT_53166 [Trichoplax adhaerens]|eukprot:XP_002109287.1 hypothetical protein TRIADDRAFT_53166 [Trichoplax adhaerens]